ncbi:hypothetical protein HY643_03820 [Candidatus Woesearchaeota archaeon]|nr:hypothetical protein [Candidatus Woesearchaeota archaeon]
MQKIKLRLAGLLLLLAVVSSIAALSAKEWLTVTTSDSPMTPGNDFSWRVLDAKTYYPHGQTFVTQKGHISGVAIDLLRIGNPGDIEIRIGDSFGDGSIFTGIIPASAVPQGNYYTKANCDFVEVKFDNREVIPGKAYYIWLKPTSGQYSVQGGDWYSMCITKGLTNLYQEGVRCDTGICSQYTTSDVVFRTFFSQNHRIDQGF